MLRHASRTDISIYLYIHLSIYLSFYLSFYLSIYLSTQRILDAFFRQQTADAFYNPVVPSDDVSAASSDEETVTDVDSVVSSVSSTVSDSVSSPAHVASVTRQRSIFEYFPRYSQARSVQSPGCAGMEAHGSNATPR